MLFIFIYNPTSFIKNTSYSFQRCIIFIDFYAFYLTITCVFVATIDLLYHCRINQSDKKF